MIVVDNSKHTNGIKFRLKVMLGIIPICFLIRAMILTYGIFGVLSLTWWFDIAYFSFLEVLPLLLVLLVSLRVIQSTNVVNSSSLNNNNQDNYFSYKSVSTFSNSSY